MPSPPAAVVSAFAPTGTLRAAINYGNPVLVQGTPPDKLTGVTIDLVHELAQRLGVPLKTVPFSAAGKVFEALKSGDAGLAWDVAFLAIEPVRAAEIDFTAPYVIIEGAYAVRQDSPIRSMADVDKPGVRIALNIGSAYDLFLTRTLKHAALVREPETANEAFERDRLEVLAGVKQPLAAYVNQQSGAMRMLGAFMEIRQAMGMPKGRDAAAAYLRRFVEEMKASGFVADALKRAGQGDAAVAPPG